MAERNWGKAIRHAWNAFVDADQQETKRGNNSYNHGPWSGGRPDHKPVYFSAFDKTILSSIYLRMAVDASGVPFRHVRVDDTDRYLEDMDSQLNNCLTVEANLDQAARQFFIDVFWSLFQEGCIALVPTITTQNPHDTAAYDIKQMRVGRVVDWADEYVWVEVWRPDKQRRVQIEVPKSFVGIVENPFYAVMNEPNSTVQRLTRKLNLLDSVDEQSASGKLDLIIQLPYVVKSESRRQQAEQRRKDIEFQLKGSQYGIAYTDGTEKITQLNRPAENNLLSQVEYLVALLYTQLGITPEIMNGTADEDAMTNYLTRTIETVLDAVQQEMHRKFLTKTARSQGQAVRYFRDIFKSIPLSKIAEVFDVLSRNEIGTANEFRQVLGWKPSTDPKADQLVNSNMSAQEQGLASGVDPQTGAPSPAPDGGDPLDQVDQAITDTFSSLGVTG